MLSIIIPVDRGEKNWLWLVEDLASLTDVPFEVIAVCPTGCKAENEQLAESAKIPIHWIESKRGRARQLNVGARASRGSHLWFIHSDSRLDKCAPSAIQRVFKMAPAIYFFKLKFDESSSSFTRLNEWGVRFRSEVLKIPFGDQGFLMPKTIFEKLGGFSESAIYGEDHDFIWHAHRQGIPVVCLPIRLFTSARKYTANGWLKTTLKHLALTAKQAMPHVWALVGDRWKR